MLRVELERIRERGIAVNDKELAPHLHAIAAPVRSEAGDVVAAVSIAAHTSQVSHEELAHPLRSHLMTAAEGMSAALGYRQDDDATIGKAV